MVNSEATMVWSRDSFWSRSKHNLSTTGCQLQAANVAHALTRWSLRSMIRIDTFSTIFPLVRALVKYTQKQEVFSCCCSNQEFSLGFGTQIPSNVTPQWSQALWSCYTCLLWNEPLLLDLPPGKPKKFACMKVHLLIMQLRISQIRSYIRPGDLMIQVLMKHPLLADALSTPFTH